MRIFTAEDAKSAEKPKVAKPHSRGRLSTPADQIGSARGPAVPHEYGGTADIAVSRKANLPADERGSTRINADQTWAYPRVLARRACQSIGIPRYARDFRKKRSGLCTAPGFYHGQGVAAGVKPPPATRPALQGRERSAAGAAWRGDGFRLCWPWC